MRRASPYRKAGALLVFQRVVLASRAAAPVLHGVASGPMSRSRSSIDLTGIDGRPAVRSRCHVPNIYIYVFLKRQRESAEIEDRRRSFSARQGTPQRLLTS